MTPSIVLFTGDAWEHVCPAVRVIGPVREAGLRLLRGDSGDGEPRFLPQRASEADVVILQRDFPRHVEVYDEVVAIAREAGKPIIYELDDLLLELPAWHPDTRRYRGTRASILQAVVEADAVTCTTAGLRDYLRRFNPRVHVLPNYLDDLLWEAALRRQPAACEGDPKDGSNAPVVIGFLGGSAHAADLEELRPPLLEVSRRYGLDVRFRFWGGPPPADILEWYNVEWIDPGLVDYAEFAEYFSTQSCDLFIAPLRDVRFNRCKSSLKFLEYSALGVPGVYSRLPPYETLVEHGRTGLLASTTGEWTEALSQLIGDPKLRADIGLAARRDLEERWLLSQHASEWKDAYERVASASSSRHPSQVTMSVMRQLRDWQVQSEQQLEQSEHLSDRLGEQASVLGERLEQNERELLRLTSSIGWMVARAFEAVGSRLAPLGSWRQRQLERIAGFLVLCRRHGVLSTVRRAITSPSKLRGGRVAAEGHAPHAFQLAMVPGRPCAVPAISVLALERGSDYGCDERALIDWAASQTCTSLELVRWDQRSGLARLLGGGSGEWQAPDAPALIAGLQGRYVCVASQDLLLQPEIYLEANLAALECEDLAFTVNARGRAGEMGRYAEFGRLPGGGGLPLLRQVARRDCLGDRLGIDLSRWIAERGGGEVVAGKLVVHTTSNGDVRGELPYRSAIAGAGMRLVGDLLVATPDSLGGQPPSQASRTLHPAHTVLPLVPDRSETPTVIVVMPFLAVGGAERVALDMMRCLQHELRFIVFASDDPGPSLGTMADAFRQVTPYVYTAPDYLSAPLRLSFLEYLIRRLEPRTLYIANGAASVYDALGELKENHPQLRTVNQVYDYRFGWINRYDDELVSSLDGHIGVNRKICEEYVRRGARPEQVYLIEHAVDPDQFDPDLYDEQRRCSIRRKLALPESHRLVTFMSRLHPQKRPMDFVELARRFSGTPDLTFLLVGEGPLAGAVDAEVARVGLGNLIRRPFQRPSSDVVAISDVVVLPSEYEGMPLVVLENQAMGKPVVVTDVGNTRQVMEATGGGVVIDRVGDVASLKKAVSRMLDSPPDPAATRRETVARFGVRQIARKYVPALLGE